MHADSNTQFAESVSLFEKEDVCYVISEMVTVGKIKNALQLPELAS